MKVLFISYSIPPYPESQTSYNVMLIRGLVESGAAVTVLTAYHREGDQSLLSLLPGAIKIVRTPLPPFEAVLYKLGKCQGGQTVSRLLGIAKTLLLPTDIRIGWGKSLVAYGQRILQEARPDVVISSSGSPTAHLGAASLHRMSGIPWVAVYGDPWTLNPIWPANMVHIRWMNDILERSILPSAALAVFTTEESLSAYRSWLGDRMPRAAIIPVGYSRQLLEAYESDPDPTKMIFRYVGVAFRATRNLEPLFYAFAATVGSRDRNTRPLLEIVGPHSGAFVRVAKHRGLDSFIVFRGRVDYVESVRYVTSSHVLVLIGNPGGLQVPGKVYLYLASGRPVLYLGQQCPDTDPTWQVLRRFPGVVYSRNDERSIAAAISDILSSYQDLAARALERRSMAEVQKLEWQPLGKRFAEAVASVC